MHKKCFKIQIKSQKCSEVGICLGILCCCPTSLRQVEYLAAMEDDHLLCMQVFCGASEAGQPEAGGIPGCHRIPSLIVHAGIL
jgi:hypothetical protein